MRREGRRSEEGGRKEGGGGVPRKTGTPHLGCGEKCEEEEENKKKANKKEYILDIRRTKKEIQIKPVAPSASTLPLPSASSLKIKYIVRIMFTMVDNAIHHPSKID